ncbi:MAG TPA: TRC40/GET3/ArsA family transport-energizing ATPase [Bryobacterales bacterium]|nr:TRC40/GET3/ArsA family transport-energizing ATPase [Bryobacterales bacterium]
MRILLFSGKGGVGKTSIAAATGLELARRGYRTLVLSVDPAHSLADAFDLGESLFSGSTGLPHPINKRLAIQEVNIQQEIKRHWSEIWSYIVSVLQATGIGEVEAEELAIFPGMEEISSLMYVNEYRRNKEYDVVVVDCAPTAESLRFVSMPNTLEWYMKNIFHLERTVLKAVRPVANRVSPVKLPSDSYFGNIKLLFDRLEGIGELLEDSRVTTVRLVTNPEKMVLRETQRAFVYFALHGMTVDGVVVNRVLPEAVHDRYFRDWQRSQQKTIEQIEEYFAPVPVTRVPLFAHEVVGEERLAELARALYQEPDADPAAHTRTEAPYHFEKNGAGYRVRLHLAFAQPGEVSVFKKGDELVVEVGNLRRHVGLPTSMAALEPRKAKLDQGILTVELMENRK